MKPLIFLIIILNFGSTDAEVLSKCETSLATINSSWPKYPSLKQSREYMRGTSYAHVMVEGIVKAKFIVAENGSVNSAEIEHSKYTLVGRDAGTYKAGHFDRFLEINVIEALKLWQYKTIATPCIMETSFEWKSQIDTEQENAIHAKKRVID